MNFRFTLCCFLLAVASSLFAQKTIRLQHDFQPETTYASEMTMDIEMKMNMKSGPDGDAIPDGVPESTQMDMHMEMSSRQLFGSLRPNGDLGFEMKYDSLSQNMRMNGEEQPMPPGASNQLINMSIMGSINDGEMQIDSLEGVALDSATAVAMKGNLQGLQVMIKFPDRPLMVGDTFSQTNQMLTNAGAAGQLAVEVHQTYELESWDDEFAYLSLTEEYDFSGLADEDNGGMELDGKGGGKGRLVFSIKDRMAVIYETNSTMLMNMDMMGMIMSMDTKNTVLMKNRIVR